MDRKTATWIGVFIGSTVGSFIPSLWGASPFDLSSLFLSAMGGFLGIWFAYKMY